MAHLASLAKEEGLPAIALTADAGTSPIETLFEHPHLASC